MSAYRNFCSLLAFAAALLLSSAAQAQLFRAYLAPTGNDANPCTLPAPCRLLPAALAAVIDGGEIWMLDSANYNTATVTIGKSVSILAVPGAVGSVLAIGGPAISITAAGLRVGLRNLVIGPLPASAASEGVIMTGASALTIENSLIANLPSYAVDVTGTGTIKIANTILRNNGNWAVRLQDGAQAWISGTQLLGNIGGVLAFGAAASTTTTASVSDSAISGGSLGLYSYASALGATTSIIFTRSTIDGTGTAIDCQTSGTGSAVIAINGSTIANNNVPWTQIGTGSVIRTLGNNHITDNAGAPTGVLTSATLQ